MRIGIDVGGSKCLAVALDEGLGVVGQKRVPTPSTTEQILDVIAELANSFGPPLSVGVGVPAPVPPNGELTSVPNLSGLRNVDLPGLLRTRLDCALQIGNDANCAALGEFKLGAAVGTRDAVVLSIGTGVGAGVILDGSLRTGAQGMLGEIGDMVIRESGPVCGCGQHGCWESIASGLALDAHARVALHPGATGRELIQASRDGDATADKALGRYTDDLALGIRNVANLFDPAVIVLGGGVMDSAEVLIPRLGDSLSQLTLGPRPNWPKIVQAELGNVAGAIGAALLDD